MKTVRNLLAAASLMVLAACATTTPYQAASKPGGFDGYTQTMIENDRARVTFGGNSLTDRETVENYLLYRAAEMAIERGFDYFTLAERDTEEKTRVNVTPRFGAYDPYFDYAFYRPAYGWSRFHRYSYFHDYNDPFYRGRRGAFAHSYWGGRFGYDPFFNDYDVREVTKYRASAEVMFGRGLTPDSDNAFNAKEVMDNLGATIVFPEEKA